MSNDDKNSESDSNVWASYSDLFTNVAIIFLVMFVFALIKSAMNQIQTVQVKKKHENELKAKLSPKDVQKNKDRIAKVEAAVDEMQNYEQVIDKKVQELNEYAKKLQANKQILKEMIESQNRQDSLLKIAEEKLKTEQEQNHQKQFDLEAAKIRITMLDEELERAKLEVKQRESNYQKKIEKETKSLKETETRLSDTVAKLSEQLQAAKKEAATLSEELKRENQKESQQVSTIAQLKQQLGDLEQELEKNRNSSSKLAQEKNTLGENIRKLSEQNNSLKSEYSKLQSRYSEADANSKSMSEKLASLSAKLAANEADAGKWKSEFDKKFGEAEKLRSELGEAQKRFNSLASTLRNLKDTVKNGVAVKLEGKFKEQGLDAQVNLKTGEVILLSGEGFNFEKGSASLSPEAKKILKKLIPVYSSVLLEDEKVLKQISYISMEGHSSPSFGGKPVDLYDQNAEAYAFNMRLSSMRAASVANYLMGKDIGDYPHKERMKSLLQSVGFGYMKPVPLEANRVPASTTETQNCGQWDCYKSQRVQINFTLKDNMEEIHKIIEANGGIR